MAGDGGRVPDVSEQQANHEEKAKPYAGRPEWRPELGPPDPPTAHMWGVGGAGPGANRPQAGRDPASVLAALLAESPGATVAAIEALLTSDEAVDHTLDEMMQVFVDYGPNFARLNPTDMRLVALRLSRAPCRSLLSKAPKWAGDA